MQDPRLALDAVPAPPAQGAAVARGGPSAREFDGADPRTLLVSVHMPKTAGTSFSTALQAHFGTRYRADYGDLPMHAGRLRRNLRALGDGIRLARALPGDVGCVHGHFLPLKYRAAAARRDARFVTWLRDPVERVLSHYHFWRRDYRGEDPAQPLRNRMLREDWSLERFALGPELRDLYRQYLWAFEPRRFAFIGITEHYAEDLERFAHGFLGGAAPVASALVNPGRPDERYPLAPALRARIEAHHGHDVALYRWALSRRNAVQWSGSAVTAGAVGRRNS